MTSLRLLSLFALVGIAVSSPLPQELNRDAEIVPDDIPLKTADESPASGSRPTFFSPPRRTIIAVHPISLGDIFRGGESRVRFPFTIRRRVPTTTVIGSQDPIFGSPSFVDVPASSDKTPTRIPLGSDSQLHQAFEDMINIQRDLIGSIFSPQSPRTRPVQRPVPETSETEIVPQVDPEVEQVPAVARPLTSFINQLIPAMFGGAGIGGGGPVGESPFRFPNFGDLPADFDNSTYKEETIDGQVVRVNETIKKTSTPFGSSVVHFKIYSLKPDGTEETIEDVEVPEEILPSPASPSETPEQLPEQFPEELPEFSPEPLIPQEEQVQEPFGKDFAPTQTEAQEEFQLPTLDESLNEIP